MGKYQAYPEYKDSGNKLLDEIPKHWQLTRIKYVAEITPKKPRLDRQQMCSFIPMEKLKTNSIVLDENRQIGDVYDGYTYFADNDILMAKVTPCFENKNIAIAKGLINQIGFGSSEIYPIRVNEKTNNRFLFYRLQEDGFMELAIGAMTGAGGLRRVPSETLANYIYALPTYEEQEKIANFLDHETAKIDTLIDKQQQLIQLLKEKRQAVISHAVTKGLNPSAPMRDSGVEWLGEVPEHWSVSQVGHCAFVTKLTGFEYTKLWRVDEEGEVVALRGFNVKERKLELNDVERISSELSTILKRSKLAKGDIVFPCTGTIGNAAMIEEDDRFHINQNIAKIRFDENVSSRFAIYWLTSSFIRVLIDKNNTSGMQPVVLIGDIRKLPIPRFDNQEQEAIADYLDSAVDRFNVLISNAVKAIELMQERRTALISAAVTGKIDVRHHASRPAGNDTSEFSA